MFSSVNIRTTNEIEERIFVYFLKGIRLFDRSREIYFIPFNDIGDSRTYSIFEMLHFRTTNEIIGKTFMS